MRDSSLEAYDAIRGDGTVGKQQRAILACFEGCGWLWLTRSEIAKRSGITINAVAGRVNELVKAGRLLESESRRPCSITGRNVHALCLPDRAVQRPLDLPDRNVVDVSH